MEFLIYPLCGAFAGVIGGLFGVGGGLVVVPVLSTVFAWQALAPEQTMHMALGTSLTTIIATAASSTLAHHRRGSVDWRIFLLLVPGIIVGTWLGGALADQLGSTDLRIGFGIAECLLGLYMWRRRPDRVEGGASVTAGFALTGAGVGIGTISSLAGIGGGTLTVPYLVRRGLRMTRAVGTSAACGLPIALSGSLSYMYWGWDAHGLPPHALGYVYWPAALGIMAVSALFAPLGAHLAHRLPAPMLRRGFAVLLLVMGGKMLLF